MEDNGAPGSIFMSHGLVDEQQDTHRYVNIVSPECRRWLVRDSSTY